MAVLVAVAALVCGCAGPGPTGSQTPSPPSLKPAGTLEPSIAPATSGQPLSGDIPPGHEIAEGGGGPAQYTFREEWRRALAAAQGWRSGAYLIHATGEQVNDEGVAEWWMMTFTDRPDSDAVLRVEIDPWGGITKSEEFTGDDTASFVDEYTARIPFAVIDSDQAVAAGRAALAERYNLLKTKDPRLAIGTLNNGVADWGFMLFYSPSAEYVTAHLDALSGEALPPPE